MKIKVKLTLGVGLLFIFILMISLLGVYYIHELNKDTQNILAANHNTLDYTRNMLICLDEDMSSPETIEKFSGYLNKQQRNVTEIGEKELTEKLTRDFEKMKTGQADSLQYVTVRKDLTDIMLLNTQAIERKSDIAKETASAAIWWIAITGSLCFVIAFFLLVKLPGNIANPIHDLTSSIQQIAAKNYQQRVNYESHNEFGELARAFNTMALKLQEYDNSKIARLLFEKKRIETLINNMHDAVIGLDENKTILFANEVAIRLIGSRQQDLIGKNAKDIALTNDLVRYLLKSPQELDNKKHNDEKPLKIFANNKESYFDTEIIDISITPTGEKQTRNIGSVILLRNITPFKELDFAKTNFIATVSHEFKTPISSIKMSLQLLQNQQVGKMNAEQESLLEGIRQDADRLLKFTSELLNMTQVESGNIQLSLLPSDPREILKYALDATKTQAEQKKMKLDITAPNNLPKIYADSEKTTWVLTNLISNAISYSHPESTIFVSITKRENTVLFSVRDNGLGIPVQYREKIFDRYFRIPGTLQEGTGLGLAISKEFIEAQGGYIQVDSEYGSGSTFVVTLNAVGER